MEIVYWLYLESHIYVNYTNRAMLLYDTHTGKRIETTHSNSIEIIKRIYQKENLGVIEISKNEIDSLGIDAFIKKILSFKMGKLIRTSTYPNKPIILLPILSLNYDIDKYNDNSELNIVRDISNYLLEVNLTFSSSLQIEFKGVNDWRETPELLKTPSFGSEATWMGI